MRLYHCSLPHYPSQATFLRSIVLVINVHCALNVCCVTTTSAHCVGVHHVVSAPIVATYFHHVGSVHHFLLFFIMLLMFIILLLELMLLFIMLLMLIILVFIMLLLVFIMLCWCSSCCFPPFYDWIIPTFVLSYKLKFYWRWMVVGCLWL